MGRWAGINARAMLMRRQGGDLLCALCVVATAWVASAAGDSLGQRGQLRISDDLHGELGVTLSKDEERKDYSKHDEVPKHLSVLRKVVTASWLKCKLACNTEKACAGFKFTPMVKDKLPLCEILATTGGDNLKPANSTEPASNATDASATESPEGAEVDASKELVMKKFEKAKELVVKAEATHKRTESYASDMRERLEAIQKEVHAGKDQVRAIGKKEAAAKKRVVAAHATVKKAKIEVKALEQDEEARADRKGQ